MWNKPVLNDGRVESVAQDASEPAPRCCGQTEKLRAGIKSERLTSPRMLDAAAHGLLDFNVIVVSDVVLEGSHLVKEEEEEEGEKEGGEEGEEGEEGQIETAGLQLSK